MTIIKIISYTILFNFIFLQNSITNTLIQQQANIVSESDGLDAFYNPAGFAMNHGWETFIYGAFDESDIENGTLYFGDKDIIKGIGYYVGYTQHDKLNKPSEYNVGFGFNITKNLYSGLSYDHNEIYKLGSLWRPYNFLSTGLTYTSNNDVNLGISIRPFNTHKFSFGFEYGINLESEIKEQMAYVKLMNVKGLDLMGQYFPESEQFNINLGLNLNSIRINSTHNSQFNEQINLGFTYGTQKRESIINKEKEKKYVKLTLDHLFIEEKPIIPKWNFEFPSIFSQNKKNGTQLRTWIEKVDKLTNDSTVEGMIINLKEVNASFNKRIEIRNALQRFKNSGKKIIVYTEQTISNINYHLISVADSIYINPLTGVDLKGMSLEVTFYRGLLDSLDIKPEVFRVNKDGKSYKSAADPILNTTMSDEFKENYNRLLDDLYLQFINDIATGRNWSIEKTKEIVNNGPYWSTQIAIDNDLVDGSKYPDEFRTYVKNLTEGKKIINFSDIKDEKKYTYDWKQKEKSKIAIIYAVGGIISGKSNPGPQGSSIMGDKTIIKSLQEVGQDNSIDAIILRIDSGGGSALASDQMWKEISNITNNKEKNVPFIASMSGIAASGGYYIACEADTIIAHPTTITGSIGVISMAFNLSDLYNKIGINKEVIKRGDFSDLFTQSRQWTDEERQKFIDSTEEFYREFKLRVISGRENLNDINELDNIAMGQVWTGNQALENGLIDILGGTNETIEIAKQMAGINQDAEIEIVEYPKQSETKNKKTNDFQLLFELMPESLKKELNYLNIIPILHGEHMYFMMPHHITVH